jgi:hypothetical protein
VNAGARRSARTAKRTSRQSVSASSRRPRPRSRASSSRRQASATPRTSPNRPARLAPRLVLRHAGGAQPRLAHREVERDLVVHLPRGPLERAPAAERQAEDPPHAVRQVAAAPEFGGALMPPPARARAAPARWRRRGGATRGSRPAAAPVRPRDRVELGAPVVLRDAPFGAHPPPALQTVQRRVERSLLEQQHLLGGFLHPLRHGVAVTGSPRQRLQQHEVQAAAEHVHVRDCHRSLPGDAREDATSPFASQGESRWFGRAAVPRLA